MYNVDLNYVLNFSVGDIEAYDINEAVRKARKMVEEDTIISNLNPNVSYEPLDFNGGTHIS